MAKRYESSLRIRETIRAPSFHSCRETNSSSLRRSRQKQISFCPLLKAADPLRWELGECLHLAAYLSPKSELTRAHSQEMIPRAKGKRISFGRTAQNPDRICPQGL